MLLPRNYGVHLNEDSQFEKVMTALSEENVTSIIETGTKFGTGSTLVLARTGKPVVTIECNPKSYEKAQRNLAPFANVRCVLGYSMPKKEMLDFIAKDDIYESDLSIICDDPVVPREYYRIELGDHDIPEDRLAPLIRNNHRQIILLDSAGGIGLMEYRLVMSLPWEWLKNKILVLDDIAHVKHYRSVLELKTIYPGKFNTSDTGRWGWIDFSQM